MRPLNPFRRAWEKISEPRHLKLFYLGVYTLTLGVGIITLIRPPSSIEGPLGPILATAWASLLALGGLGGMLTVTSGWWWAERLSVWLAITGAGVYASTVLYLHFTTPPESQRLTQAGIILLAMSVFILRLLLTRGWAYEPRR